MIEFSFKGKNFSKDSVSLQNQILLWVSKLISKLRENQVFKIRKYNLLNLTTNLWTYMQEKFCKIVFEKNWWNFLKLKDVCYKYYLLFNQSELYFMFYVSIEWLHNIKQKINTLI